MFDREMSIRLVSFLNDMLAIDPSAIALLVSHRVPCNTHMAEHPTVQVGSTAGKNASNTIGILGLLNGFCGTIDDGGKWHGFGPISAMVNEDGSIVKFMVTGE